METRAVYGGPGTRSAATRPVYYIGANRPRKRTYRARAVVWFSFMLSFCFSFVSRCLHSASKSIFIQYARYAQKCPIGETEMPSTNRTRTRTTNGKSEIVTVERRSTCAARLPPLRDVGRRRACSRDRQRVVRHKVILLLLLLFACYDVHSRIYSWPITTCLPSRFVRSLFFLSRARAKTSCRLLALLSVTRPVTALVVKSSQRRRTNLVVIPTIGRI